MAGEDLFLHKLGALPPSLKPHLGGGPLELGLIDATSSRPGFYIRGSSETYEQQFLLKRILPHFGGTSH